MSCESKFDIKFGEYEIQGSAYTNLGVLWPQSWYVLLCTAFLILISSYLEMHDLK